MSKCEFEYLKTVQGSMVNPTEDFRVYAYQVSPISEDTRAKLVREYGGEYVDVTCAMVLAATEGTEAMEEIVDISVHLLDNEGYGPSDTPHTQYDSQGDWRSKYSEVCALVMNQCI